MVDCIWSWIMVCDCAGGKYCVGGGYDGYLSIDSPKGHEIEKQYDIDVHAAMAPIREKFRGIMAEWLAKQEG